MLSSVPDEIRKAPQSVAALARSYYHLEQLEKARATLSLLSPAEPSAVFLGAQIADEMRDYETAERLFKSVETTYPDQAQLKYSQALVAYHSRRYLESREILQRLLDSGSRTPAALNLLGWTYYEQGHSAEAIAALQESIQLAPSDIASYLDETRILLAQRSLPAALQSARCATRAFPNAASSFELQGTVERAMGEFRNAIKSFSQAIQLDASRPQGRLGLAQTQADAGMSASAHASFEEGIKKFPRYADLKVAYAASLLNEAEACRGQSVRTAKTGSISTPPTH
jgi:tetratricopeptide (TPR) repeat protein